MWRESIVFGLKNVVLNSHKSAFNLFFSNSNFPLRAAEDFGISAMSLAPPYLSSSQPLPKFCIPNHSSSFTLCSHRNLFPLSNSHFHLAFSTSHSSLKPSNFILRAASDGIRDDADAEQPPYEEYEVELEQPYGLKFAKGRDGGTYIDAIAPGGFADKTGVFTVGDKVIATRYSFQFELCFLNLALYDHQLLEL